MNARRPRLSIALAVAAGLLAGLGAFTIHYGQGLSYFSPDPRACANCHIMNAEFASWAKGPHHGAARCVDCHLPHETLPKLLAKAANGYHHSKGFTLQDFHEPILIKPGNAAILQASCMRCHGELVHDTLLAGAARPGDEVRCVHCHRSAGHGA
jgi:cytochrome c nitrite reductase small subunit